MERPAISQIDRETVGRVPVLSGARTATLSAARERVALICALVLCDAIAVSLAFALAYVIRFKTRLGVFYEPPTSPLRFYSSLVFWLVPLVLAIFAGYRLYHWNRIFEGVDEYVRVVSAATMSTMQIVLISFLLDSKLVVSRGWILISWIVLLFCALTMRFLFRRAVYLLRRSGHLGRRIIVVGSGPQTAELTERIRLTPETGLQVARVIDTQELTMGRNGASSFSVLRRAVADTEAEAVVVSAASVSQATLAAIVRDLTDLPADLQIIPGMYEVLTTGVQVREIRGLPLVTMNKNRITGFDLGLKWLLDYSVAATAVLALAPLLLTLAILVRATSPGPIFHRRRVIGQRGRRFDALKFRTMYVDGDAILERHPELAAELARTGKLVDDPRITPVGRWMRRLSLDELPQLFNVLRGQMSLVGPRMITEPELRHFGPWRDNLFTVKPGLTGLWQVSGRSDLGYEGRVRLDMHYIRTYSIWSDMEILLRTVPAVIKGAGAY